MILSIIIPVFNSEKFLEKCLNSICNQVKENKENIELILIDDCSIDKSFKILEKYSKLFKFIKLIKLKKNLGPGNSRKIGIKSAIGEYVCFVDSDDKLINGSITIIIRNLKKFPKKDMFVLRNYITGRKKNKNLLEFNQIKNTRKKTPEKSIINCIDNFNNFRPTVWNFIFKNDFLKSNSIFYNSNIRMQEDWAFVVKSLCLCKSFKIIEKPTHIYQRFLPYTLGNTTGFPWVIANLKIINEIYNFIKKKKKYLSKNKIKFLITIIERSNYFVFSDILICSNSETKKISKYLKKINLIIPGLSKLGFKKLNNFYKKNEKQILFEILKLNYKKNKIIKKVFFDFVKKKLILFPANRTSSIALTILKNIGFEISMFLDNNDQLSSFHRDGVKINTLKYLKINISKLTKHAVIICYNDIHVIKSMTKQLKTIGFKNKNIRPFITL